MQIHAYPTDARVPVDLAEAHRVTERHLTDPRDLPVGITRVVTEFAAGFTVVAVRHAKPDLPESFPPSVVHGSVCVIDRDTGAVSYWPTYPAEVVAAMYTEFLRTGELVVAADWPDPDAPEQTAAPVDAASEDLVIDYSLRD